MPREKLQQVDFTIKLESSTHKVRWVEFFYNLTLAPRYKGIVNYANVIE